MLKAIPKPPWSNQGVQSKWGPVQHSGSLTQASDEEYDAIMHINLRSAMQLCNRVIPGLAARKDGAVILTSSISGLRRNGRIGV